MVDLGADTNPLAQAVVMVAGHMGQHCFAGGQAQRIKKFRAAKGLAGDLRFHRRVVVMHDVVGAQQHVAGPVCKRTGQRAFGHVGQLAQRCIDQGVAVHLADQGMGKHAVANELGDKARSRAVIERVGVVPLVQAALLHHADLVAYGKSLELVVGDKQRRGVGRLEDAAHLVGEPLAQVNIEVGERLVEQQQAWLGCQGSGQGHALLLDEPFSNLDVDLRERLAHEVRAILKAAGATALFVTHDQLEAFAIGDVIGVMHQGHLHQWDDAYALYHRPATRFVAEFIGHGVFAPAQIRLEDGDVSVHTPLGALRDLEECPLPSAYEAGLCDVLLRADDIVHDDASPVKAQITRKAFRGSEFLYTLRLASGEVVMTHVPSHHNHELGEWIGIRPQVDHVVTFARGGGPGAAPAASPSATPTATAAV